MAELQYRPWGDFGWLLNGFEKKSWVALSCVATEKRSVSSIIELSKYVDWMSVISIDDPDPMDEATHQQALEKSRNAVVAAVSCKATFHQDELKSSLDTIRERVEECVLRSPNVVLDVTCFPKRWFFPILRFLYQDSRVRNLVIAYTAGEGYAEQISENYELLRPIQTFASIDARADHDVAFIGVGFHSISMLTMFGDDRPKALRLLFPFPPGPPGLKRNWRFVEHIERTMKFADGTVEPFKPLDYLQLSATDASQAFDAMRAVSKNGQKTSLMAPYGPKPISLAMCLFSLAAEARDLPEVPVYYAQPQRYATNYTERAVERHGKLQILGYSVKYEGRQIYQL
ncbi:hypothetical protein HNR26_002977 [Rhizobium rosettiformans]|uniref:Uncharacterized protein n=2 Tax=Rhizobium rosettiformans TaxID=1368430 RepID=A0A4S8PXC1_9HYPH|nr:hypothetical protein [Rhizobium rosettiformans]MBB5276899.1 hypothetical protein [Rhizobium rosettiformans]THV34715.1 hypothetical protein FAA86_13585 [Rhizobium rosettiformans W3]